MECYHRFHPHQIPTVLELVSGRGFYLSPPEGLVIITRQRLSIT